MIQDIQRLVDTYYAWLKDKTLLRQMDSWIEITTPYLDRHNDRLQIYAKRRDGGFVLTDDGYVLEDLEQSGCMLDSAKRQALLKMTLNGFGVQVNNQALEVNASSDNFAMRKHNLVQAMLAVNDLFYLASPMVASLFYEDVVAWFELSEIRYTPKVQFTGKTGYGHLFDFVIPKSKRAPERILKTINQPKRDTAQAVIHAWTDTKEIRSPDSRAYALLNDSEQETPSAAMDALRSYDIKPVLWTQRDSVREELAA